MKHLALLVGLVSLVASATAHARGTYSEREIVNAASKFFGSAAAATGELVEDIFRREGRPVGYITGQEVSGAITVGLRYGDGSLNLKGETARKVFWSGPSIGFDVGGTANKVFVLVYNLSDVDSLFQRFPGVEGSAYKIAGFGVNYLRTDGITLVPIHAGVGLRLGANVGYLKFSRERKWGPF